MTYYNIAQNLKTIIALNDAVYAPANTEIAIVFANLSTQDKKDNGLEGFAEMLFTAMSTLVDIDIRQLPFGPSISAGQKSGLLAGRIRFRNRLAVIQFVAEP